MHTFTKNHKEEGGGQHKRNFIGFQAIPDLMASTIFNEIIYS